MCCDVVVADIVEATAAAALVSSRQWLLGVSGDGQPGYFAAAAAATASTAPAVW